ncbi:hypothetical protein ACJZ2D_005025 [Fusarium nematophilum]
MCSKQTMAPPSRNLNPTVESQSLFMRQPHISSPTTPTNTSAVEHTPSTSPSSFGMSNEKASIESGPLAVEAGVPIPHDLAQMS